MHPQRRQRGKPKLSALLAALLLAGLFTVSPGAAHATDTTRTTVTTTADTIDGDIGSIGELNARSGADGKISLREALTAAANTTGTHALTVDFDISTADPGYDDARGVWVIQPAFALPLLDRGGVTLDASTQPGSDERPSVVLDSFFASDPAGLGNGLTITSSDNTVRRLAIINAYEIGVLISGSAARNNHIVGCVIGISPDADDPAPNQTGVELRGGATDNTIGGADPSDRNIISGNERYGVIISGSTTTRNTLAGNWIGTGHGGATPIGNLRGVQIKDGAHENTIGGTAQGNVIAANYFGIEINSGAKRNTVAGNIIGLAADGVTARANPASESTSLGNKDGGIIISSGAQNNIIGGTAPEARNIISNNGNGATGTIFGDGVYINGAGTQGNAVIGNYIGVDSSGILGRGNLRYGVWVREGADGNFVGGAERSAGNTIAYNGNGGVRVSSTVNQVANNLVGVGADGKTPLGNQYNGVHVTGQANVIGPGNLIAYSQLSGILTEGSSTSVQSNNLHSNDRSGICVRGSDSIVVNNVIRKNGGRTEPGAGCDIQGGVVVHASNTEISANAVRENYHVGIRIAAGRSNRILGNSISENVLAGIQLEGDGNENLPAPVIMGVSTDTIVGKGCQACRVEVFVDSGDEGNFLIGSVDTDSLGSFALSIPTNTLVEQNVTATNTDPSGNTSPFARAVPVPGSRPANNSPALMYLPYIGR